MPPKSKVLVGTANERQEQQQRLKYVVDHLPGLQDINNQMPYEPESDPQVSPDGQVVLYYSLVDILWKIVLQMETHSH